MPGYYERTPEIKQRISEALRGHPVSQETRDKISAGNKGKKPTEEHRQKNSAAHKGKKMTPEAKQKRIATMVAKGPGPTFKDRRSAHPHYNRWYSMIIRCTNEHHPTYRHYGARGIKVCDEWLDPWAFYRYLDEELGVCPPGHSLDRIDVDGHYEPGNVRWASRREQAANRRPRRLYKLRQPAPRVWVIEPWGDRPLEESQPIWD